ncbi:mitochondrial chaperone BCS1 [Calocera cornea HHB12733]|uniref:Mitochondrial chaperone BCS1 n=1 Tax=Calocera cornea HHB12733 TaxID=1353952 RepID=A0A165GRB5_9BASI|nr:mitochondrial chaperone BCS1 [Calocera cornea HHB12733]
MPLFSPSLAGGAVESSSSVGTSGSTSNENAQPIGIPGVSDGSIALPRTASGASLWENVLSNPIFSAGLGLIGAGAGLALVRRSFISADTLVRRRLLTTLEIPSTDKSHPWVLDWISRQASPFSVSGRGRAGFRSHQLSVNTSVVKQESGATAVEFRQVPGEGTHFIRYRGAWMQVKRERNSRMVDIKSGTPWESVSITTLSRDRGLFDDLLREAYELGSIGVENKTVIWSAWGAEWRQLGPPRRKRQLDSVVLAQGVKERIVEDIKTFMGREKWYADRGIPYRRGYLLSGPPGSGKSSFVQALAGTLSMDICILNLSERGQTDDKLNHLLINAPARSIILLEDIDAAFNQRAQTSSDGYQSAVTFSGLLNALDGVGAAESRIIFMTTNHPAKLDPALIRPGRVDMHETLDDATPAQARVLFERFYAGQAGVEQGAEKLEAMLKGRSVTMAALQGLFIVSAEGPEMALRTLGRMLEQERIPI